MNDSSNRNPDAPKNRPDRVTKLLMRYSRWKRRRLVAESQVPTRLLLLRTAYLTACILVDGVFLPWIIVGLNRTVFSCVLFTTAFIGAVFLQAKFYFRWKRGSPLVRLQN